MGRKLPFSSSSYTIALLLALSAAPLAAQTQASPDDAASDADAEGGSAIIVTGVRGGGARTVADSPVPIDVIGPRELQSTGRTGLKEILGNIIPSLTMPAQGGGGTSASVRPISIRGLSGDYLLVLVNGKRRHTTSLINNLSRISGGSTPVDIDLIPTNAVGRIEVLRDGAAAQYGSDAISGVINIILDSAPEGGEFTATAGQLYEKGAALLQQTLSYGKRIGADGGFIRFAVEGKYHDSADSSGLSVPNVFPLVNGQPEPARGDRQSHRCRRLWPLEPRRDHQQLLQCRIAAGRYVDGLQQRDAELSRYQGRARLRFPERDRLWRAGQHAGSHLAAANLPVRLPGLSPHLGMGLPVDRGPQGRPLEAGISISPPVLGQDRVKLGAVGTLNPSLGPSSPTSFYMGRQRQTLWVNNLDLNHDYDVGLAKPLTVALGVEHRWEKFQNIAGEPDSYRDGGYVIPNDGTPFGQLYGGRSPSPGLVSFTGTSPADARTVSRNNFAGYVDLSTYVTKSWFIGVAGRYEHYTDSAGDTVSGKISTRYEILPGLAIPGRHQHRLPRALACPDRILHHAEYGHRDRQQPRQYDVEVPAGRQRRRHRARRDAPEAGKVAELHRRHHVRARAAAPDGRRLPDPGR